MTGRRDSASTWTVRRIWSGLGSGRREDRFMKSSSIITSRSASPFSMTSPWMPMKSRCTGPGAPEVASRKACRSRWGNCSTVSTATLYLVVEAKGLGVLNFLVGVAVLVGQGPVAGDGDDRREAQEGVLEAGGQVGGADGLGHAHRRAVGGAGVAVGHVNRRLFTVADDALNAAISSSARMRRAMEGT